MNQLTIQTVNKVFGCDVQSKCRKKVNVSGRVAFSFYMRTYSYLKLREIGELLNILHSTVYSFTKTHERFYKYDLEYRHMFDELMKIHPLNTCQESKFKVFRFSSDPYKKFLSKRNVKSKKI